MKSNKRAALILFLLVFTSVCIFLTERKFLVAYPRGGNISIYNELPWIDKIIKLADDIEGIPDTTGALKHEQFFAFGSAQMNLSHEKTGSLLTGKNVVEIKWTGKDPYGGWGKGAGLNFDPEPDKDFINFLIYVPESNKNDEVLKINLEEDDNDNRKLDKEFDDTWSATANIQKKNKWQLISIPLSGFKDENPGGDGILNITSKGGLHTFIIIFTQPDKYHVNDRWYFDFFFFSRGKIENEI